MASSCPERLKRQLSDVFSSATFWPSFSRLTSITDSPRAMASRTSSPATMAKGPVQAKADSTELTVLTTSDTAKEAT